MSMTDREIKKWRESKEKELKNTIKRAKTERVHPAFSKLLEKQDKVRCKHKFLAKFHDGATEEQLVKFEKTLGVTIPVPYREFLKFTDGTDLGEAAINFFGVNDYDGKDHTLYTINDIHNIYNIEGAHARKLLIIGEDITGVLVCINIETGEIIGWESRYIGQEEFVISTDFHTFLDELTEFIEDRNSLTIIGENKKSWLVARKTIKKAWKNEIERASKGLQTRDWTNEEFELLRMGERVPGYEGHYMKSVEFPEYASDPDNIQFSGYKKETQENNLADNIIEWHEKTVKELKYRIKKAREIGMHPSFINLLEVHDKANVDNKLPTVFYDGATEDELVKFENTLGVTIPAPYREILKFTDGAYFGDAMVEFFGVNNNEKKHLVFPASYRKILKYADESDKDSRMLALFGENGDEEKMHTLYGVNNAEKTSNIIGAFENDLLIIGKDIANILVCINTKTGEIVGWDYRDIEDGYFEFNTDLYTYFEEDLIDFINNKEEE